MFLRRHKKQQNDKRITDSCMFVCVYFFRMLSAKKPSAPFTKLLEFYFYTLNSNKKRTINKKRERERDFFYSIFILWWFFIYWEIRFYSSSYFCQDFYELCVCVDRFDSKTTKTLATLTRQLATKKGSNRESRVKNSSI